MSIICAAVRKATASAFVLGIMLPLTGPMTLLIFSLFVGRAKSLVATLRAETLREILTELVEITELIGVKQLTGFRVYRSASVHEMD